MKLVVVIFLAVINLSIQTAKADYIFSAPPRESEMAGITIYGPLVQRLSKVLGEKVVYEQADNWPEYTKKMRNDEYDIVFDGPHFNAWRMKHLGHILVASLPGHIQFELVTFKQYKKIRTLGDLVGRPICGMPSPNLATDMILTLYKNPAIQPQMHEVKGGIKEMYEAFKAGDCQATIMRVSMYEKLTQKEKDRLRIIKTTKALPNQTFSVSKRLKKEAKKIEDFLVSEDGSTAGQKILERFSKGATHFQRANAKKFRGAETYLEDVVFGW